MSEVVGTSVVTYPSCSVQGIVRSWGCGCQGIDYPSHPFECKQPRPYFDALRRSCQKVEIQGANPQVH